MTILLIRHGETSLNVARVLQPAATPLSPRGERQAVALAARLAAMGVRAVLSSDLPRARQTAEAIGIACGLPVETTPRLRERDYGDWRGRPYDQLPCDPLTMTGAPPSGESAAAFTTRVAAAFDAILQRRAALDGPLAVVTHGLVIRALLTGHLGPVPIPFNQRALGNTGLSIVDPTPPFAVELLDCTAHLQDAANGDQGGLVGG